MKTDIMKWNTAQDDWHTTQSAVDLRVEYRMSDGREVTVEFAEHPDGVHVKETFDAETENTPELQRTGWQAILDNFAKHAEGRK